MIQTGLRQLIMGLATSFLLAGNLVAGSIVSVGGEMEEIPTPSDVTLAQLESPNVRIFAERDVTLASDLAVEHQGPGSDPVLNPGQIPAGTAVRTYYVHFDPVGEQLHSASGSVTFDMDILGLILLSGDDGPLEMSHASFGAVGTSYPDDGQGFNNFQTEDFNVSNDLRTLSVTAFADAGIDAMRVFVSNIPEPSSLVLLTLGILGVGSSRRRWIAAR